MWWYIVIETVFLLYRENNLTNMSQSFFTSREEASNLSASGNILFKKDSVLQVVQI